MPFYYNSNSGAVNESPEPLAWLNLHSGLGWHGPFETKQAALDYYQKGKASNPGWKAPTGLLGNVANVTGAASAADAIKGGLGLSDENIRSWMIRIGEILLGIVLVGVGVAKLSGTTNAVASLVKAKIP